MRWLREVCRPRDDDEKARGLGMLKLGTGGRGSHEGSRQREPS
jgi:hypothetical protein